MTRKPCSSLSGVESEDSDSVLFPFCPSGTIVLAEGNTVVLYFYFFGMDIRLCRGFIRKLFVMDHIS